MVFTKSDIPGLEPDDTPKRTASDFLGPLTADKSPSPQKKNLQKGIYFIVILGVVKFLSSVLPLYEMVKPYPERAVPPIEYPTIQIENEMVSLENPGDWERVPEAGFTTGEYPICELIDIKCMFIAHNHRADIALQIVSHTSESYRFRSSSQIGLNVAERMRREDDMNILSQVSLNIDGKQAFQNVGVVPTGEVLAFSLIKDGSSSIIILVVTPDLQTYIRAKAQIDALINSIEWVGED